MRTGPVPMASLVAVNWPCASLFTEASSAMPAVGLRRSTSVLGIGLPVVRLMTEPWTVPATDAEAARSAVRAAVRRRGQKAFIERSARLRRQGPRRPDEQG